MCGSQQAPNMTKYYPQIKQSKGRSNALSKICWMWLTWIDESCLWVDCRWNYRSTCSVWFNTLVRRTRYNYMQIYYWTNDIKWALMSIVIGVKSELRNAQSESGATTATDLNDRDFDLRVSFLGLRLLPAESVMGSVKYMLNQDRRLTRHVLK